LPPSLTVEPPEVVVYSQSPVHRFDCESEILILLCWRYS